MLEYIRNATSMLFGYKKSEPVISQTDVPETETPCEKKPFSEMCYLALMTELGIRSRFESLTKERSEPVEKDEKPIKPINDIDFANLMSSMSRRAALEKAPDDTLKL